MINTSWIESHQTLRRHPKLLHLCELTQWSINETIGVLHSLWWWTLDYAEDGDLKRFTSYQVALAIEAKIEPEKLFPVLIETKFLDKDQKIHDWWTYAGTYLHRKYHTNNPAKLIEIKKKYFTPKGQPKGLAKTETGIPKVQLPTNHNLPTITYQPAKELFDLFWKAYPRKVAKPNAFKVWEKINIEDGLMDKILLAIETQKQSTQWQRNNGEFIPYPATWLNGKRWEDEIERAKAWNE